MFIQNDAEYGERERERESERGVVGAIGSERPAVESVHVREEERERERERRVALAREGDGE